MSERQTFGEIQNPDPKTTGRCGDKAPAFRVEGRTIPAEFCKLPAGHRGWHRSDNGSEWSA